jgi:hypothetical protein
MPSGAPRICEVGFIAVVLFAPLALGGAPAWARPLTALGVASLVAHTWLARARSGAGLDPCERAWAGLWIVVTALFAIQLAPLPSGLLRWIGAYPDTVVAAADSSLARLSPTPLATASHWATFTTGWALAWLASRLRRAEVGRLAAALCALLIFEAVYGTWSLVHGAESILGIWPRQHYLGDATGTFVNRNHFAGLLALGGPFALAWLLRGERADGIAWPLPVRCACAGFLSLLLGAALVASHSRAGLLAAVAGAATWIALGVHGARSGERLELRRSAWLFAIAAGLGAIWLGSGPLIERFAELPLSRDRFTVWWALFDLPARTWVLGAGAGAFGDVFKTVQPPQLATSWAYAHNDWLELLLDFGILGLGAIAVAGALWGSRVLPRRLGALQAGALGGVAAVAIHALVDFDLHVPGVALPFWAMVGIAVNPALAASRRPLGGSGA